MINTLVMLFSKPMIQKDPGAIVGPIAGVLGGIINFIFNLVYQLTVNNSLGISIILLTIVARVLLLPLAVKQQKSMIAMQKLNPEMEKIKKKYGDSKDPEIQRKMNAEIQGLYAKHKVNPLSGCLPMFIQMPIFFGLSYVMNQSFRYITKLGDVYAELAAKIQEIPGYIGMLKPLAYPLIPNNMEVNISVVSDLQKVLQKFTQADWSTLFSQIPADAIAAIEPVLNLKQNMESFLTINLVENAGLAFPGILIPILAAAASFLSSYLLNKLQPPANSQANSTQKIMLIVMPIMMGFFTISMPAGVGLYWITSNIFQLGQQFVLNRKYAPATPKASGKALEVSESKPGGSFFAKRKKEEKD